MKRLQRPPPQKQRRMQQRMKVRTQVKWRVPNHL